MNKTNKFFLTLLVFIFSYIRLLQFFSDFGNDFYSTLENYPFEIADGYGLYHYYALILGVLQISFSFFWISISIVLSLSLWYFLISLDYSISKLSYNTLILFTFVLGYIIPWFAFQNYRYGSALLLLGSISLVGKSKYFKFLLSVLIHSLSVIFIPYFVIVYYKITTKKVVLVAIVLSLFFYLFVEQILIVLLSLIGYENYTNDLLQISEGRESILLSLIRCFILFFVGCKIIKDEYKSGFIYLLIIYCMAILFTPFHGRFIPFIYIILVKVLNNEKSNYKLIFLSFLIIESYFSIAKSIFHYGV